LKIIPTLTFTYSLFSVLTRQLKYKLAYYLFIELLFFQGVKQMLLGASLITVSALLVYFVTIINVGRARAKYKVMPPAMTGDENFERALRVQQNMLEQLVLFLPIMWIFSYYVSELWGAIIGGVWILGRVLYAWGYYQEAKKRMVGFGISSLSIMALLLTCLYSLTMALVGSF